MNTKDAIAAQRQWLHMYSNEVDATKAASVVLDTGHRANKLLIRANYAQGSEGAEILADARKSSWIEVEAPIHIAPQQDAYDMWTKIHTTRSGSLSLQSIP
ncbi:MAG: hypothetical protein Q9213_003100 [Squamulea squamosa]